MSPGPSSSHAGKAVNHVVVLQPKKDIQNFVFQLSLLSFYCVLLRFRLICAAFCNRDKKKSTAQNKIPNGAFGKHIP